MKHILKRIKRIEIKTNQLVEGLISGSYRSIFKGRGIEFSEIRDYIPGDDIRAIDWNVTARFNHPYIKEFIEERDLNVYIIFDISASSNFGFTKSKKETGFEIAASLMFAALKNNDNIGLALFTNRIEKFIRPRKGKRHLLKTLRELIYYTPKNKQTDINTSLTYLNKIIKKRSIIFIISDFVSPNFLTPLRHLKNKHDIILINLSDTREEEIPDIGYVYIEDQETGEEILINTSDQQFKTKYKEHIQNQNNQLVQNMKKLKIDILNIKTDQSFHIPLQKFFKSRKKVTA